MMPRVHVPTSPSAAAGAAAVGRHGRLLVAALPAVVVAWVVAAAALVPDHALTGVHAWTGTGYDDGVYLAAADALLHGALPWRDYDLLHPPGILWLGLPAAAVGELTRLSWGLGLARVTVVVLAGANVALAGLVVRTRGPVAVATTSVLLALVPTSFAATQTWLLEPWLTFFTLLSLCLLCTGSGRLASRRRVVLAGALLGLAVSVKLFAVLVGVAVLVALAPRRRAMLDWTVGMALGAAVPTLPLAILAPRPFVLDVVVAQLRREDIEVGPTLHDRLAVVMGLATSPRPSGTATWLLAAAVAVIVLGLAVAAVRRELTRLHVVVAAAAATTVAGMVVPRQFFDHYAYFLLAVLVLPVGLGVEAVRACAGAAGRGRAATAALAALGVALSGWLVPQAVAGARTYTAGSFDPTGLVQTYVPHGACVATDLPTSLVVADRLAHGPRCRRPLDPFGAWFVRNHHASPHTATSLDPGFVAQWSRWLEESDFVLLTVQRSNFIPWTPALTTWFDAHFVLIAGGPGAWLYARIPGA